MNSQEENSHGSGLGNLLAGANLLLAGPSRRPIDPTRALAILATETTETAMAGADGLRKAVDGLAQEIRGALGMQ